MFNKVGNLSISANVMPKVFFKRVALEKMKAFIECCDKEIGWLGTATLSDNVVTVHDMFLFEQEVHETTCELNEQAIAKWYEDVLNSHQNGVEIVNTMRVWGHSHVNMSATPSGQDESQFKELARGVNDFFIRIIGNKKGEMRLDYYDAKLGIVFNNMDWGYEVAISLEEIKAEIKEKVKIKPLVTARTSTYASPYANYSWYDKQHEKATKSNKAVDYTDVAITSWEDITSAEELVTDFGFLESDLIEISELVTPYAVISYMAEEKIDDNCTLDEARHLLGLATEYVMITYGM